MAESQNELWARLHQSEQRIDERRFWKEVLERLERIEAQLEKALAERTKR